MNRTKVGGPGSGSGWLQSNEPPTENHLLSPEESTTRVSFHCGSGYTGGRAGIVQLRSLGPELKKCLGAPLEMAGKERRRVRECEKEIVRVCVCVLERKSKRGLPPKFN